MLIVLTTVSTSDDAERLSTEIVTAKLAVCVQIMPKMTSVYFWEGEVRSDDEYLLLIKTLPQRYEELETFLYRNHAYEVPEVVAIESSKVSSKYLSWVTDYLDGAKID